MAFSKSPEWLPVVIEEFSTASYRIEYGGFLSNHILHGIIAIARLGGDEKRVRKFVDWYTMKRTLEKPLMDDPARSTFGKVAEEKPNFFDLMDKYRAEMTSEGSIGAVVRKEFPWLGKGSVTSLFHGLIHTGYGAGCGSDNMILEGLAYLNWGYEPIYYDEAKEETHIKHFGRGKSNIIDVLVELQKNNDLIKRVSAFTERSSSHGLLQSRFLGCVQDLADVFIKLANSVQLPDFFDPYNYDTQSVQALANWLVIQVLTVFCKSKRINDFILLHGVTSSWGLRHIVRHLNPEDAMVAIRDLLALVLAAYVVERCSPLSRDLMVPEKPLEEAWEDLRKETLAKVGDEHIYKLVQVCYDLWSDENLRGQDYDPLYFTAVRTVLDSKFSYVNREGNTAILYPDP